MPRETSTRNLPSQWWKQRGEGERRGFLSMGLLTTIQSSVAIAQGALEGLGYVSSTFLITGAVAGVLSSYVPGRMFQRLSQTTTTTPTHPLAVTRAGLLV